MRTLSKNISSYAHVFGSCRFEWIDGEALSKECCDRQSLYFMPPCCVLPNAVCLLLANTFCVRLAISG